VTSACSRGPTCSYCPAFDSVVFSVISAADGGVVSGVQATMSGPTTATMSCSSNNDGAWCQWPDEAAPDASVPVLAAGSYTLQVTAPGFKTTTVTATVTYSPAAPADDCPGCAGFGVQPSTVTLDPS